MTYEQAHSIEFSQPASLRAASDELGPANAELRAGSLREALQLGAHVCALMDQLAAGAVGRKTRRGSLRAVLDIHQLPHTHSTLWRAVAIYKWSLQAPEISRCQHLGVGHMSVLIGAGERHRLALLRMAENQRWSRRQLERKVAELKRRARELQNAGASELREHALD